MSDEIRVGGTTVGGRPLDVRGRKLEIGEDAPDFVLVAPNFMRRKLSDYAGKIKLLSIVPSLDTGVCSAQTRRFNQEATALSDDIVILTISADLPFTQARWCGAEGIENIETLSTHMDMKFSDDYGVHVLPSRTNQRAIIIVDQDDKIAYTEYVVETGNDVDFDAAISAANALL